MAFNIDEIEVKKKVSIISELKDFVIIFVIIFWFWWLFINAQLLVILFDNLFWSNSVAASNMVMAVPKQNMVIKHIEKNNFDEWDNMEKLKKKILSDELDKKLESIKSLSSNDMMYKPSYESLIKSKLTKYNVTFNTLPPDVRIVIPKIWVNAPVQNLTNIPIKTIETANYDEYLYHWVIKYPYTPDPWTTWNVFIFWHTSYYWWKHNPYATVFAKIPRLKHWDYMNIVWNWKVYKYKIIKKFILHTYQVEWTYKKYQDWQYLTIMWCYPIWSDAKRMLIVAKRDTTK